MSVWLRVLRGFDLVDSKGTPSASKIGAFVTLNVALFIALVKMNFAPGTAFIVSISIAALFGRSVYLQSLGKGNFNFNETTTNENKRNVDVKADATEMLKAILARRKDGEEPSGKVEQVHGD